jgi:superfamily I DNA/RNA helicase
MILPNLDDLIGEQITIYDHSSDEHLFIAGPPGSGKTTLAVLRARFLKNLGLRTLVVTKNRMLKALVKQLGGGDVQANTMHSFVYRNYRDRIKEDVPQVNYIFDWPAIIQAYEAAGIEPVLDHLVIDEGQNLPKDFFHWAIRFAARTLTVFADEDQTTDSLRASFADICGAGMPNPIRLSANHRNTPEIALVAEHFHRSSILPPANVQRAPSGETPSLKEIATWDNIVSLVSIRFSNRGETIGLIVQRTQEVSDLKRRLVAALPPGSRIDTYLNTSGPGEELDIRMLEPGITVLTSESVIGLEFDAVYLHDLGRSLPCTVLDDFRRMYMLCARARNSLVLLDGPDRLTAEQIASLPEPRLLTR